MIATGQIVLSKVRSLLDHSCAILISFKIVVFFNVTSADFVLMSADVVHIENDHNFERNEDRATVF